MKHEIIQIKEKTSSMKRWQCNYVDAYKIHGNGDTIYMTWNTEWIYKKTKDTSST